MLYKVHNLSGTSDNEVPMGYRSWKDFWESKTWQKANSCHRWLCSSSDNIVGAHVQLSDGGREWYIVPLCQHCNISLKNQDFYVSGPLVPVNDNYQIKW